MRKTAIAVVDDRKACVEAWNQSGSAVEFAIKALIHRKEGFDRWPSRSERPDLHTHDLQVLCSIAAINLQGESAHIRAAFKTVFGWDRSHAYSKARMPRIEARAMFDAAFGPDGVIEWLRTR